MQNHKAQLAANHKQLLRNYFSCMWKMVNPEAVDSAYGNSTAS